MEKWKRRFYSRPSLRCAFRWKSMWEVKAAHWWRHTEKKQNKTNFFHENAAIHDVLPGKYLNICIATKLFSVIHWTQEILADDHPSENGQLKKIVAKRSKMTHHFAQHKSFGVLFCLINDQKCWIFFII
jgi:hypothetical protein